jgi:hypothetical protein
MRALFVNLRDGRSLPFQVPDDFSLEDDENYDGFMTRGGGFLSFSDGTQLWVSPHEFVTAYLVPMNDGQRIALRV